MSGETILTRPRADDPDEVEYQRLRYLLKRGKVVPFLGAGASLGDFRGNDSADSLPTGRQLANRLARMLGFAENELDADDLIEVASCFDLIGGRHHLEDELKEVFGGVGRPGPLHRFIVELNPPLQLIITTNYDTLVEQAFRQADRAFHLVMTPIYGENERVLMWWGPGDSVARTGRPDRVDIQPSDIPVVYKIHGGVAPNGDWISSVITEDDYFVIGGRIYESSLLPPRIADALNRSSLLFLGYSLRDVHVRFLIRQLVRQSQQSSCLVSRNVSRMDRIRFRALRVAMIEVSIADFLERLLAEGQLTSAYT